jgi:hypothetical protein
MTEMTQERRSAAELEEQSATDQAKDKVQEAAGQVQQQVGEKAQQMRGQAADGIRQQLDSRSTQAGEQLTATADGLRRMSQQLQESNATPAQYAKQAAEPVERLGRYLTQADGDRILRDAERFARQRPLVTVIGGATLGFLVARFIKASGTGSGTAQSNGQTHAAAALPPPSRKDDSDGQSDS